MTDYKPTISQEEAIKAILSALEGAWNNHNEEVLLALLDEDFIMSSWSGDNRSILFRRQDFDLKLGEILSRSRSLDLGTPDISINDGEATAYVAMTGDGWSSRGIFKIIRRNGKWFILEWEIEIDPNRTFIAGTFTGACLERTAR
jgi:hypothetical protein